MSIDDFFKTELPTWHGCESKNRSELRSGLENIGGPDQIRTKILGDGGRLRTRGGHPEVVYEKKEEELPKNLPDVLHGKIVNTNLFVYDDNTDTPTGQVVALKSTNTWYAWDTKVSLNRGHTEFVAHLSLDQKEKAIGPTAAYAITGTSLLFGQRKLHTTRVFDGTGFAFEPYRWVYQAPSGRKYSAFLDIGWINAADFEVRTPGNSWLIYVFLDVSEIYSDGTLGTVQHLINGSTFTVANTVPNDTSVNSETLKMHWDNVLFTDPWFAAQPFKGVCPSPTGDEVIYNFLVHCDYYKIKAKKFAAKTIRLTITEGSPGALSASMAVDKAESDCLQFETDVNVATPATVTHYERVSSPVSGGTETQWVATGTDSYLSFENVVRGSKVLHVRSFEPKESGANVVTGLYSAWHEETNITSSKTVTASGTHTIPSIGNPFGSCQRYEHTESSGYIATEYRLFKDADEIVSYIVNSPRNQSDTDTETYETREIVSGVFVTGTWHTGSLTRDPDGETKKVTFDGAEHTLYQYVQKYTETGNQNLSWSDVDVITSHPYDYFSGDFRQVNFVGIGLVTNNVVSIDIEGYDPAGELTPDLYARSYSVAAGNTPSGPATNDSKWLLRPYVSDSLEQYKPYVYKSWNPRRPKLWAVAIRKNVAWL